MATLKEVVDYLNDRYNLGFVMGMMGSDAYTRDNKVQLVQMGDTIHVTTPLGKGTVSMHGPKSVVAHALFPNLK